MLNPRSGYCSCDGNGVGSVGGCDNCGGDGAGSSFDNNYLNEERDERKDDSKKADQNEKRTIKIKMKIGDWYKYNLGL